MSNIYWPVYKNLESEVTKLAYSIHIDDNQLTVYSSLITDLILRASAEIESLSKELYYANDGSKTGNIRYDDDAIKYLNKLWDLDKKVVLISSPNCFQSIKELRPFVKNEPKTSNNKLTYTWNNAYQNLKHDRANSLHFGSVKYLFDIMAALFVLNIYNKNEVYDFQKDGQATDFPVNLGSELFACKVHKWGSYDGQGNYVKRLDFQECLYLTKMKDESRELMNKSNKITQEENMKFFMSHAKLKEYLKSNKLEDYKGNNLLWDVLGKETYIQMLQQSHAKAKDSANYAKLEYEGILNKNEEIHPSTN